jgi:hypothetical protein
MKISSKYRIIILLVAGAGSFISIFGQNLTNSPYSMFGVGELESRDADCYSGMGNTGIGMKSSTCLNRTNPASYANLDSLSFFYDLSLSARRSSYVASNSSDVMNSTNFRKISMGFRILPRWATSFGVVPYSKVGYNIAVNKFIEGSDEKFLVSTEGSGGLTQFYWGNGFNITKNLSLGITTSYLFGTLKQSEIDNAALFQNSVEIDKTSYLKNFRFEFGAMYSNQLSEKLDYTIGAIYGYNTDLNRKNNLKIYTGSTVLKDALTSRDYFTIPTYYGIGFSLTAAKSLTLAADYKFQNWSSNKESSGIMSYTDSHFYAAGLQYRKQRSYYENYLQKIFFQVGATYEQTYLSVQGHQISDRSFSFGLGLPIKSDRTMLRIAVETGYRGASGQDLFQENYQQITINLTTKDLWFFRSKYE